MEQVHPTFGVRKRHRASALGTGRAFVTASRAGSRARTSTGRISFAHRFKLFVTGQQETKPWKRTLWRREWVPLQRRAAPLQQQKE
jgi:hypothetical protein